MSALLVPVHLAARVLTSAQSVPALSGSPFGGEVTLKPGVHLHWALPDALTRARSFDRDQDVARPGVPDRWLVVRFNAVTESSALLGRIPRRSWRAWVVQSDSGSVVALDQYKPPTATPSKVLTAAGPLDPASRRAPALAGWGCHRASSSPPWPMGSHAYYPSAAGVFGMHDDLADLSDRASPVSYAVVGWCSAAANDPVASAPDALRLCLSFKWSLLGLDAGFDLLTPGVHPDAKGSQTAVPTLSANVAAVTSPITEAARAGASALRGVAGAIKAAGLLEGGRFAASSDGDRLICHGALFLVDPDAPTPTRPGYTLSVHPTLPAAVAATVGEDPDTQEAVEALIHGLDRQLASPRDVLDLAYEAHQRSFASRPGGACRWYGQILLDAPTGAQAVQSALTREALRRAAEDARRALAATVSQVGDRQEEITEAQGRRIKASPEIHPRLIRVVDRRGADAESWWVDLENLTDLTELCRRGVGASWTLPDAAPVHAELAPRWRRARAPGVLLRGAGRGTRHGEDGRFEADGTLRCRIAGHTVRALEVRWPLLSATTLAASRLLSDVAKVRDRAGLPTEAVSLLEEALILDPASQPLLVAQHQQNERLSAATSDGLGKLYAQFHTALLQLRSGDPQICKPLGTYLTPQGTLPSPVGWWAWETPWCPLFIDAQYGFKDRASGDPWQVERSLGGETGARVDLSERAFLVPAAPRVLHGLLFDRTRIGADDGFTALQKPPADVTGDDVRSLDLLSASLSKLDDALQAKGWSLMAGDLKVSKVRVIDTFGRAAGWLGGASCELHARPTTWTRLHMRLTDGAVGVEAAGEDADRTRPCVAGYLVPDLLEHTLEIYDEQGEALGQVEGDAPVVLPLQNGGGLLRSRFVRHPWVDVQRIERLNPNLRDLILALEASPTHVPTTLEAGASWALYESAVSALIRVSDTARATLDQRRRINHQSWALKGRPMVLVRAAAWVESVRAQDGKLVSVPPPALSMRLGDLRFSDDGVVGRIEEGRLIPVDVEAAKQALLNVLPEVRQDGSPIGALARLQGEAAPIVQKAPVRAPFVDSAESSTMSPLGATPNQLLLLVDLGGGIRGVTGALPVKRLTIPADQVAAAMGRLNPTVAVGPVLCEALQKKPEDEPGYKPPALLAALTQGEGGVWVADDGVFDQRAIPKATKDSLPRERVRVARGWVRAGRPTQS